MDASHGSVVHVSVKHASAEEGTEVLEVREDAATGRVFWTKEARRGGDAQASRLAGTVDGSDEDVARFVRDYVWSMFQRSGWRLVQSTNVTGRFAVPARVRLLRPRVPAVPPPPHAPWFPPSLKAPQPRCAALRDLLPL